MHCFSDIDIESAPASSHHTVTKSCRDRVGAFRLERMTASIAAEFEMLMVQWKIKTWMVTTTMTEMRPYPMKVPDQSAMLRIPV